MNPGEEKDSARALPFSSALPLAYYLAAYAAFGAALLVVAFDPSLPGTSFYQPRFVSLVHLLTLGWLTGSILGSFYIVGPLALGVRMPVTKAEIRRSCFWAPRMMRRIVGMSNVSTRRPSA